MKNSRAYFDKYGYIFGVSSKYEFGKWTVKTVKKFDSYKEAIDWLHTEEYDFRVRELASKSKVRKLVGSAISKYVL